MQKRKYLKKRNQGKHRKTAMLCGLFFVCFLLICGGVYFMLYRQVNKVPKDKVAGGIYIGHVNVSGMTAKQAREAVDREAEECRKQNITFQAGEKSASASLAELGFNVAEEEKLIKKAVEYAKDGSLRKRYSQLKKLEKEKKVFEPVYEVDAEMTGKVLQDRVGGLLEKSTDASIKRENRKFVITDEKEGFELDEAATVEAVSKFLNGKWDGTSGSVEVIVQKHTPEITRADLEVIQDKLGTFSTYCGSGEARVTNIINGAKLIDNALIMPGEEFSVGKAMQPFTAENGYVEAGAFENGEVVQSMAGGICQVSTTLYNAVINAELEVTSRQPHSMTVHYVKPSHDAAIAGDYKDFRFRNNYDTPVFIEGYVYGGNVVFNVYGKETRPAGRTVEFVSETVSETEPKKTFVADGGAAIGKMSQSSGGKKGIKARLWKVVSENGKEVSREIFNNSTYRASSVKVTVGTASANPEYRKKMQAAIKTQNEGKIKAAIAEIKAKEKEKEEKEKEEKEKEEAEAAKQPQTPADPAGSQPNAGAGQAQ